MICSEALRPATGLIVDWDRVRYFKESEWQKLNITSSLLVYALDEFRHNLGAPVYISPANWGKHSQTGYHYPHKKTGNKVWAVDIFPDASLAWAYHTAMKSRFFAGIGVYPFWEWADKNLQGGLHLDIRHFETNKKVWFHDGDKYHMIKTESDLSEMEILMLVEGIE